MPCNCSGIRMRRCNCRFFGYPLRKHDPHNVVLVTQNGKAFGSSSKAERVNFFLRFLERLYDKCAGYNLRYCPLRGLRRDKYITNAVKELIIITCFLIANFVVFLNIATRMLIHFYLIFTQLVNWFKRLILKSTCDYPLRLDYMQKLEYDPSNAPIN